MKDVQNSLLRSQSRECGVRTEEGEGTRCRSRGALAPWAPSDGATLPPHKPAGVPGRSTPWEGLLVRADSSSSLLCLPLSPHLHCNCQCTSGNSQDQ